MKSKFWLYFWGIAYLVIVFAAVLGVLSLILAFPLVSAAIIITLLILKV